MDDPKRNEAQLQWREATARARALWRVHAGGTYEALALELAALNGAVPATSLAQNLRPRGRRPRSSSDLLARIATVLTNKLSDRRPDLDPAAFEEAMRKHISGGAPSPLEDPGTSGDIVPSPRGVAMSPALFTFDLWTPGHSISEIIRDFAPHLGLADAEAVGDLSRGAIIAIGAGDFGRQREIADEAIRIGDSAPQTPLAGEGFYLKAEALRLMADFEGDRSAAKRLRLEAEGLYAAAETALRGDPRPIRGRARTMEVMGDLDGAMAVFDQSVSAVEARRTSVTEGNHLSIAHERIRSLRHKINCLAAMHAETPLATPAARRREEEIRRLIAASEPHHREALQLFTANESWWRIEWFMAQVLHAKAWAAIKEDGRAARRLEWSLDIRLKVMPDDGDLTAVELGNLHWWSGVAREARGAFDLEQERAFEEFKSAIDRADDRRAIKTLGRRFLTAGTAPWTPGFT